MSAEGAAASATSLGRLHILHVRENYGSSQLYQKFNGHDGIGFIDWNIKPVGGR